jgi:hypothetical protein
MSQMNSTFKYFSTFLHFCVGKLEVRHSNSAPLFRSTVFKVFRLVFFSGREDLRFESRHVFIVLIHYYGDVLVIIHCYGVFFSTGIVAQSFVLSQPTYFVDS